MYIFREKIEYTLPFYPIFLCGSKYKSEDDLNDKRNVLRSYIENTFPYCKTIILEKDFKIGRSTKDYLGYHSILLKDLMHVEQIAAIYAKKIFIIHETISTGAEVGMFAVFPLLASKTCVIYPDSFSIEEDKLGNVIRYAFHMDSRSENYIQVIKYYPDIEVFRFSKNKSDYYNFFHKNEIGIELGNKINSFIMNSPNRKFFFSICRGSFGKISSDNQSVQYTIHGIARELHAYIHPDTLLLHLTALVLMDGSKKELRKAKKIIDHVDYLCKEYKKILQNSINYYDKEILSVYEIKVKLNIPMEISIRQAVGYFLFMLQGIQLIHLDSVNEDDPDIRKVVFSQELLKMEDSLRGIIVEQGETEFVRNVL